MFVAVRTNGQTWIICGGRDFSDEQMFNNAMADILQLRGCPRLVVHGGACGVDALADAWATRMAITLSMEAADWALHGKAAGPIRNQKMLEKYKPNVVIAFPGGKGTADMVRRGHAAEGVDVIEIKPA